MLGAGHGDIKEAVLVGFFSRRAVAKKLPEVGVRMSAENEVAVRFEQNNNLRFEPLRLVHGQATDLLVKVFWRHNFLFDGEDFERGVKGFERNT